MAVPTERLCEAWQVIAAGRTKYGQSVCNGCKISASSCCGSSGREALELGTVWQCRQV